MGTMNMGSIYSQFGPSTQERANVTNPVTNKPTSTPAEQTGTNIPFVSNLAGGLDISVPMLVALGVMAVWLVFEYD